jgi:hypothetical protein
MKKFIWLILFLPITAFAQTCPQILATVSKPELQGQPCNIQDMQNNLNQIEQETNRFTPQQLQAIVNQQESSIADCQAQWSAYNSMMLQYNACIATQEAQWAANAVPTPTLTSTPSPTPTPIVTPTPQSFLQMQIPQVQPNLIMTPPIVHTKKVVKKIVPKKVIKKIIKKKK